MQLVSHVKLETTPPRQLQFDIALPTVNIVFLLIFFFLVSGQLLSQPSGNVDVSVTSYLSPEHVPEPTLTIHEDGTLSLNNEPLAEDLLAMRLNDIGRDLPVNVLIDKNVGVEALFAVMQRPELEGIALTLVTIRVPRRP